MKLFYSPFSPFARKARITAALCGLEQKIELVATDIMNAPEDYKKINPLIKLPALQIESGEILVNSPFICEYLNDLSLNYKVLPKGPERWSILNDQAIADGIADAAVLRRYESLRAPEKIDSKFDQKQLLKIKNALEYFENRMHAMAVDWTLREISLACAWGYLQLRFSQDQYSVQFPKISSWYELNSKEKSFMKETAPV